MPGFYYTKSMEVIDFIKRTYPYMAPHQQRSEANKLYCFGRREGYPFSEWRRALADAGLLSDGQIEEMKRLESNADKIISESPLYKPQ